MKRNTLIIILVIALAAVGYWGFRNNKILAKWELQAENQYRNAFAELNNNLNSLESELATALVTKSNERRLVKFNNIWRDAFAVQEDLGELPIAGISLAKFKSLLARIERYTYQLSQDNINENLSAKDWDNLNKLHNQVQVVTKEMEDIHNKIEKEGFKWSEQRHIILEEEDLKNNSILSSLQELEGRVDEISINIGKMKEKPFDKLNLQLGEVKEDKKNKKSRIKPKEAINIAQEFLGDRSKEFDFEVAEDEINPEAKNIITVNANSKKMNNNGITFDISKSLGEVVWFLEQRPFKDPELETKEIKKEARNFIKRIDYKENLELEEVNPQKNIGLVTFIPKGKEVLFYPQPVRIKVALDNGDIMGFNNLAFLANKNLAQKVNLEPKLSLKEAKEKVNKRLELISNRLVVINNDVNEKVLTYEFTGKFKKQKYKVYINANTGREEQIIEV
ncbi:germination protein YpeB [Sporohalobacter salinus]|uniref:germination protein YpeB n=1 Tax=Sporohalobacter salinus TaxID=1494606 RepID=UPI00195FBF01|nr:germination protein YpeB [Sporohalobacter salinus]MBM7625091.1 spore germination protein [Sporohalobacter salinus]